MRIFASLGAATLLLCSTAGSAYEIDMTQDLNGLKVTATASGGPTAKVLLVNADTVIAHCRVHFAGGTRDSVMRATSVRKGKRAILVHPVPPDTTRLKVNVSCKARETKQL